MVTIKLFGTMRIKTGCKGLEADISVAKDACDILAETTGFPVKEFRRCIITVNGKQVKLNASLHDGDELAFFSPSGGG